MTGCQLFQCSPSTPENLCQVIDQLLVWGVLRSSVFVPLSESELLRVLCFEKNKQKNKQNKSSLSPHRHTSSVDAINKSDAVSEKCLSERGNTHFKQQKVAVLEYLGTFSLAAFPAPSLLHLPPAASPIPSTRRLLGGELCSQGCFYAFPYLKYFPSISMLAICVYVHVFSHLFISFFYFSFLAGLCAVAVCPGE